MVSWIAHSTGKEKQARSPRRALPKRFRKVKPRRARDVSTLDARSMTSVENVAQSDSNDTTRPSSPLGSQPTHSCPDLSLSPTDNSDFLQPSNSVDSQGPGIRPLYPIYHLASRIGSLFSFQDFLMHSDKVDTLASTVEVGTATDGQKSREQAPCSCRICLRQALRDVQYLSSQTCDGFRDWAHQEHIPAAVVKLPEELDAQDCQPQCNKRSKLRRPASRKSKGKGKQRAHVETEQTSSDLDESPAPRKVCGAPENSRLDIQPIHRNYFRAKFQLGSSTSHTVYPTTGYHSAPSAPPRPPSIWPVMARSSESDFKYAEYLTNIIMRQALLQGYPPLPDKRLLGQFEKWMKIPLAKLRSRPVYTVPA